MNSDKGSGKEIIVNDIHSMLNLTQVKSVFCPVSAEELRSYIANSYNIGQSMALAGARHAMGGQQFASACELVDMRSLNRLIGLDTTKGLLRVEAGASWLEVINGLKNMQESWEQPWVIAQKPTGADELTIGGSVSANIHGRGLQMKPFIDDLESLEVIISDGTMLEINRKKEPALFNLIVGGYGLFACITAATLRLKPLKKLQRSVQLCQANELIDLFQKRISEGFVYGDYQFSIDHESDKFLLEGILSCYRPVSDNTIIPEKQKVLSLEDWKQLLYLAHSNKAAAFSAYVSHYMATDGQIYFSDTHQLSNYWNHYHKHLDSAMNSQVSASEIITEIYVPQDRLFDFLETAAKFLRTKQISLVYGTIRLIQKDDESFLSWAKENFACIIFNLHTEHDAQGMEKSRQAFKHLIDLAIERSGSFYLTYHRFADKTQVETCYPQFFEFLEKKEELDPKGIFCSNWHNHYKQLFASS